MRFRLAAVLVALLCSAWVPVESEPTVSWDEYHAWMGRWITSRMTVDRCLRYEPLIDRWQPDFPDVPKPVVFALMAAETACMPYADDGLSVGLMAVTPRAWTASRDALFDPAVNVYWGMFILDSAIREANGDLTFALGAYNCGWESLRADRCIPGGGLDYADAVLNFWLPIVEERRDR